MLRWAGGYVGAVVVALLVSTPFTTRGSLADVYAWPISPGERLAGNGGFESSLEAERAQRLRTSGEAHVRVWR